jgi:hypothetical protein
MDISTLLTDTELPTRMVRITSRYKNLLSEIDISAYYDLLDSQNSSSYLFEHTNHKEFLRLFHIALSTNLDPTCLKMHSYLLLCMVPHHAPSYPAPDFASVITCDVSK